MASILSLFNGGGHSFMASPVAPPVPKQLAAEGIRNLSAVHFFADDHDKLAKSIDALATASASDIEFGRIQIHHALGQVEGHIQEFYLQQAVIGGSKDRMLLTGVDDATDILLKASSQISLDVSKLLAEAEQKPKSTAIIQKLSGALQMLAEAKVIAESMADARPESKIAKVADTISSYFKLHSEAADTFRNSVGSIKQYAAVLDLLPSRLELEERAAASLKVQSGALPDLTSDRIHRLMYDCGDRDLLWKAVQLPAEEYEAFAAEWNMRRFTEETAEEFRTNVVSVISGYNEIFNNSGMLNLLKAVAVTSRYVGADKVEKAHNGSLKAELIEDNRRYQRRASKEEKVRLEAELAKQLAKVPEENRAQSAEGHKLLSLAGSVFADIEDISAVINPAFDQRSVVTLRRVGDSGIVIGRISDNPDNVLVIYPDNAVREDAVFAAAMTVAEIENGIPELEAIRDEGWGIRKATNYYDLAHAISNLPNSFDGDFFFGKKILINDQTSAEPETAPAALGIR